MATPEASTTQSAPDKVDPVMAAAATEPQQTIVKPVAAIFTKEGLQKCREQQQLLLQKSKRSKKKQPKEVKQSKELEAPITASTTAPTTPALTPPDSAQEAATDHTTSTAKNRKSRGRPYGTKPAASGKGKRKKKDDDGDSDSSYRGRSGAASDTRAALRRPKPSPKAEGNSPGETSTISEPNSDICCSAMEDANSIAIDPNQDRRKRRKKSSKGQTQLVVSQRVDVESEDVVMEDTPTARSPIDLTENTPVAVKVEEVLITPKADPEVVPTPKPIHPFFTGGIKKSENKPIHPFFAPGGTKRLNSIPPPAPQNDAASVGLITIKRNPPPREPLPVTPNIEPEPPIRSILSPTSARVLRIPGLMDAPWPDKMQKHVRGLPTTIMDGPEPMKNTIRYRTQRKLKDRNTEITKGEDLLENFSKYLHIPECKMPISQPNYTEEEYFRVSSTLHLPTRIIMTGSQLQDAIRGRTAARLPFPGKEVCLRTREVESSDSEEMEFSQKRKVHSALLGLYELLYKMLTPFDEGYHETQLWTQKYAPQHSEDVLQASKEMGILRDWITNLMVDTEHDAPGSKRKKRKAKSKDADAGVKAGVKRKKKKRRAKGDGLDDFLVDSEEEQDDMDEITDPEDNDTSTGLFRPTSGIFGLQSKKSTIRVGDKLEDDLGYIPHGGCGENGKMVNAVVISGPHGCGKTASVYAVAKEMGFQVFEVNPGSRRSGKDVLDQVGEMSKNHLVHQQQKQKPDASFFEAASSKSKTREVEEIVEKAQQTQSLILLEEADLLYEEDKQFWSTVIALMGQSKRPIVMTCNDENLLPIDSLSLHAILRLSPPPPDLAVDYLLLIAANEGHLLGREDVKTLYMGVCGDLRAAITQLNFWCQMGVGDRRAGLDWLLQRFPVGCDIDDKGETKRVISKDTYLGGMGWVAQEVQDDGVSPPESRARTLPEDQLWKGVWEEWGVDVASDEGVGGMSRGMEGWAMKVKEVNTMEGKYLIEQALGVYAEALSDVDIYAGRAIGMNGWENELLDPTVLPIRTTSVSQSDELQGYTHLPRTALWPSSTSCRDTLLDMAMTVRSLARHLLASETNALLSCTSPECTTPSTITPITSKQIIETLSNRHCTAQPNLTTRPIQKTYLRDAFSHLVAPAGTTGCYSASTSSSFLNISTSSDPSLFYPAYGTQLTSSIVHGPLSRLTCEVAPYVREIVRGAQKREEMWNASAAKRNTRASRLAAGGGNLHLAGRGRRREKYFPKGNVAWMESTVGEGWKEKVESLIEKEVEKLKREQEGGKGDAVAMTS